ncbi:MAG: nucleotidyltransferase [Halobacteriovoraceae bacterium]|nr:nucleotidyltransferase [Halobacteriovoraceae bacterium]|tara:strand:+ start:2238 stop:2615 length:378 start_codon:yes stop_codon:yes gene_type:complete
MEIKFEKLEKALAQLKSAVLSDLKSDLERDGVIQRFEYTIELLWKVAKKVLEENGVVAIAPKDTIRELANVGWISNPDEFIKYLKMRNESSHSYREEIAKKIFESAKTFVPACESLIIILKEKSK